MISLEVFISQPYRFSLPKMDGQPVHPLATVLHGARHLVLAALLLIALLQTMKERRTRQASRYHEFYVRMTDEEFRRVFRVPRALFLRIVEALRPQLTYRFVHAHAMHA